MLQVASQDSSCVFIQPDAQSDTANSKHQGVEGLITGNMGDQSDQECQLVRDKEGMVSGAPTTWCLVRVDSASTGRTAVYWGLSLSRLWVAHREVCVAHMHTVKTPSALIL